MKNPIRKDIIYPELSYKVTGCLYQVFNELGPNHREKYYQSAIAVELEKQNIKFEKELSFDLKYKDVVVGKNYIDFLIDCVLVLEIKVGSHFTKKSFDQVMDYLKTKHLKLGIIANFTNEGVKTYRVINFDEINNSNIRS